MALVPIYRRRKRCYVDILTHFMNRWFQGEFHNYRITVYRVTGGVEVLPWYIWKCLVRHFVAHRKRGLLLHYARRIPVPWRKYLRIYVRKGLPYEDGTSCCYLVPHSEKDVVSLTARAWYVEKQVDSGDLPEVDLDHLDEYKTVDAIKNDKLKAAAKLHLKHGHMKCLCDLKALHKAPRFVWSNPLYDGHDDRWGVVTIDTSLDASPLAKHPNIRNELVEFSKELETLLVSFE
jgi:hypothetical protein